jgi:hypothetical protein
MTRDFTFIDLRTVRHVTGYTVARVGEFEVIYEEPGRSTRAYLEDGALRAELTHWYTSRGRVALEPEAEEGVLRRLVAGLRVLERRRVPLCWDGEVYPVDEACYAAKLRDGLSRR